MRLFVALPVPAAARAAVAERVGAVRDRLPAARWVPPENLHLTLLFLGETTPEALPALAAALREAFAAHPGFALRLEDGGTFPPRRPARVAWVGVDEPRPVERLQAGVAGLALGAVGRPPERRAFHPHLTAARCRRPWPRSAVEAWVAALAGPIGPPFEVAEGHLVRSRLAAAGARYEVVERFPLCDKLRPAGSTDE